MVRFFLIFSLFIVGGATGLSHYKVQERKDRTEKERQDADAAQNAATEARRKKQDELGQATNHFNTTFQTYSGVTNEIAMKEADIRRMEEVIRTHQMTQRMHEDARDAVIAQNPDWFAIVIPDTSGSPTPQRDKATEMNRQRDRLPKAEEELATTKVELDVIGRDNMRLRNDIIKLRPGGPQKLPAGLEGKIVAVDPKYQYVVMNIGGNHGVLMDGEMLLIRDNEILGQVRVTRVEDDFSVANIIQDFKQGEAIEGDSVIYKSADGE